jgi:hypothetical protein
MNSLLAHDERMQDGRVVTMLGPKVVFEVV